MRKKVQLTPEARERKNAYQRAWYKKHPGKNKEYMTRSQNKKAAEAAALEDQQTEETAALEDQGQQDADTDKSPAADRQTV